MYIFRYIHPTSIVRAGRHMQYITLPRFVCTSSSVFDSTGTCLQCELLLVRRNGVGAVPLTGLVRSMN